MIKQEIIRYFNIAYIYIYRFFTKIINKITKEINNNDKLKLKYIDWFLEKDHIKKVDFIPLSKGSIKIKNSMPKLIAFYLPQYYETEINNKNFCKGFTEWYNVTKAIPQYIGHNQPQLPIDVGFYNLTHDDVMYRQIELAKQYGIYGFCFYYYWFSGERQLDKPLDKFLSNKELNMPFCLMWANANWSREWGDGDIRQVLIKQEILPKYDEKFAEDILKYFKDQRYIKINNKPLFIINRVRMVEVSRMREFIDKIKEVAIKNGFDDIYVLGTNAGYFNGGIKELNIEGIVEFGHQAQPMSKELYNFNGKFINPKFKGTVVDVKKALDKKLHLVTNNYKCFKCVFPGWDNSSRKAYRDAMIYQMTPKDYKKWLSDVILWTKNNCSTNEQLVFINAWNEWAEGAHLEPDQHYGYAYLQATKDSLEETSND